MGARLIIAAVILTAAAVSAMAGDSVLSPVQIKALFGTGKPFTAVTRSGGKAYWLTLKPDGSAVEVPKGKKGGSTSGIWDLSARGYCSKWGGSRAHCYTVDKNGSQYEVRDRVGYLISKWTP
jgi:hypothetical protein